MRNVRANKMLHALLGLALCALVIPPLAGCAAYLDTTGIDPTDLSSIQVGATRATVEKVLGKPVKSVKAEVGRIDTYEFNMGRLGDPDLVAFYAFIMFPPFLLLDPYLVESMHAEQRGKIDIIYGPDNTVLEFHEPPSEIEKAQEARREKILARAEQGDAEAQFQLYRVSRPSGKSLTWLCLAANQGYAPAQEEFGDLHAGVYGGDWSDAGFAELDRVRAYMWYSLAASSGHRRARFSRNTIANQMTPEQIAEAERLAAEWKPGDCGAEDRTAKSTK